MTVAHGLTPMAPTRRRNGKAASGCGTISRIQSEYPERQQYPRQNSHPPPNVRQGGNRGQVDARGHPSFGDVSALEPNQAEQPLSVRKDRRRSGIRTDQASASLRKIRFAQLNKNASKMRVVHDAQNVLKRSAAQRNPQGAETKDAGQTYELPRSNLDGSIFCTTYRYIIHFLGYCTADSRQIQRQLIRGQSFRQINC